MICSSVNLLLRMSVSLKERILPKTGGSYGEQVKSIASSSVAYEMASFFINSRSEVGRVDSLCRGTLDAGGESS
jgi:hypothetical protein